MSISPAEYGNEITSLFNVGTLGAPAPQFKTNSSLDRWFFCSNAWWLGNNTIVGSSGSSRRGVENGSNNGGRDAHGRTPRSATTAAVLSNLVFKDWTIGTLLTLRQSKMLFIFLEVRPLSIPRWLFFGGRGDI